MEELTNMGYVVILQSKTSRKSTGVFLHASENVTMPTTEDVMKLIKQVTKDA